MSLVVLVFLFFNRNSEVEGAGMTLTYPTVAMPSILGALVAFSMIIGPAYTLAMEREDGTLLRAKAVPNGVLGQVAGYVVSNFLGIIPSSLVILLPGLLLFPDLMSNGLEGWWTVAWVTVLGILATLPIGLVIGSLVPGVQKVGTWGMLPFAILTGISGIFFPITTLWGWLQVVAQIFPALLAGPGDAIGVPARCCRGARDRWVVADRVDRSRAVAVGDRRVADHAVRAAPDGTSSVRFPGRSGSGAGAAVGAVSADAVYNRIAMLRAERGISRRDLAEALGVHYQTIGYLERGEYSPSLQLALGIARYFEVPLEVVFSVEPFARIGVSADTG